MDLPNTFALRSDLVMKMAKSSKKPTTSWTKVQSWLKKATEVPRPEANPSMLHWSGIPPANKDMETSLTRPNRFPDEKDAAFEYPLKIHEFR